MKSPSSDPPSIQVVAFDIPWPPNYGGVIDVFYRIRALHELGVTIDLHCFRYRGKKVAPELEDHCREVFYYDRPLSLNYHLNLLPFITATRRPGLLLERLAANPSPIFFEGLHTCGFIDHPSLKAHRKMVRMHNVEWHYYRNLARMESDWKRRLYFRIESRKLRHFEKKALQHADAVFPISRADEAYFREHTQQPVVLLPAFHGNREVTSLHGLGNYALFHGKLSVRDNEHTARFLIGKVFSGLDYPLVIAGLHPSQELKRLCGRYPNVTLAGSPDDAEMKKLLREAHIQLLFTQQSDGAKIKLLNALYQGRFCLANPAMVAGSGLEGLCRIVETEEEIRQAVEELAPAVFTPGHIEVRKRVLDQLYADDHNAKIIFEGLSSPSHQN